MDRLKVGVEACLKRNYMITPISRVTLLGTVHCSLTGLFFFNIYTLETLVY